MQVDTLTDNYGRKLKISNDGQSIVAELEGLRFSFHVSASIEQVLYVINSHAPYEPDVANDGI
jgi:hypothetical protein